MPARQGTSTPRHPAQTTVPYRDDPFAPDASPGRSSGSDHSRSSSAGSHASVHDGLLSSAAAADRGGSSSSRAQSYKMQRLDSRSRERDDASRTAETPGSPRGSVKKDAGVGVLGRTRTSEDGSDGGTPGGGSGGPDDDKTQTRTAVRRVARPSVDDDDALRFELDDTFDPSKTSVENKSLLVSAALDRMGMGRYQWCIFFLCGLGYFLDLLWAQAFGLIAVPIQNEFGVPDDRIGLLSTAFSVGLTVGAFSWGFLVDVVGRKWSFYMTCLISSIFGLSAGGSNSYATLCTITAFVGLGVGGNIPIDATITLEFLPTNRRFLLALLSVFQPIGVLVCSGIAYGFIPRYSCNPDSRVAQCARADNMGWRYTFFTLGAITLSIFLLRFLVFTFRESPQYLLSRGRDDQALDVVAKIAKVNRAAPITISLEHFDEIDRRLGFQPGLKRKVAAKETIRQSALAMLHNFTNARFLFRDRTMARVTIIIWLTYIADFWGFSIAGYFLPQILAKKGAQLDFSLSETYASYMAIYAPGIVACVLACFLVEVPRLGRQWAMVISFALMAVALFLYATATTRAGYIGFNMFEYFMQSLANSALYATTPELYPSSVRGTACGLASTWGRLASILAPIAGQHLYAYNVNGVLYVAGGVVLVCPVALAFLPFDTRGRRTF